jgi:hypothetical protein
MKMPEIPEITDRDMAVEFADIFAGWAKESGFTVTRIGNSSDLSLSLFNERVGSLVAEGQTFSFKFEKSCLPNNAVSGDVYDPFGMGILMQYFDRIEQMIGKKKQLALDICRFLRELRYDTRIKSDNLFQKDVIITINVYWCIDNKNHHLNTLELSMDGFKAVRKPGSGGNTNYKAVYEKGVDVLLIKDMGEKAKKDLRNFFVPYVWELLRGWPIGTAAPKPRVMCPNCCERFEPDNHWDD